MSTQILFNVPFRYDGKHLLSASSSQGELIHAAVVDSSQTGQYQPGDQVLFSTPARGQSLSKENFESIATADGLAKLSPSGDGKFDAAGLRKAGINFAFDRNHDGQIDVALSGFKVAVKKALNFVNEGYVTYNGKETISASGKAAAGASFYKDFQANLDAKAGTYNEAFPLDQKAYDAYSKHVDHVHVAGALMIGAGAVLMATPLGAGGLILLGMPGALFLTMSKLRPDLQVHY